MGRTAYSRWAEPVRTRDDRGRRLYAVNARFGTPNPGALEYEVVQLRKPNVH